LKDLRSSRPDGLLDHRDLRGWAADALRELKACDAVTALVEALDDKDDLVRTAANQALIFITGHQEPFAATLPKPELRRAQKAWEKWWKENEGNVRTRLSQPKQP
jgi:HEAT repeat protein